MADRPARVLIAKPGLDGHDVGAKVVAHALRDAGLEVIYTGLHQSPDQIAATAVQEDVDVVGLSVLSGAHLPLTERVVAELRARGRDDVAIVVGGTIPKRDVPALEHLGVARVFPVSSALDEIVSFVRDSARRTIS